MPTRNEALALMRSFVNKPRTGLPWLKGRAKMSDCAAGFSYCATGKVTKYVWVHEMVDLMKKNGTWKKGKPQPGDAVIYDWNGNKSGDHVAMFHSVNKAGQWVTFGANQGKTHLVTKLVTGKGLILGWGTPFNYAEPAAPAPIAAATETVVTAAEEMPLAPEHYAPAPTAPVAPPAPAEATFKPFAKGAKGDSVKKVQAKLGITADGIFGPITEKTVKAFQTKKGIKVTGTVDLETWERLFK